MPHGNTGRKLTPEHKQKLFDAIKKRVFTPEYRKKLSVWQKGKKLTKEHREKLSVARRNGLKSGKIKIWNNGIPMSNSTKEKLSKSKRGKPSLFRGIPKPDKRGENAYAWKGGTTSINKRIRNSDEYKIWRQKIFIRDDFTCQKCGERGKYIHAHHIYPVKNLIRDMQDNLPLLDVVDKIRAYTPLWDLKNGITLCKKCHSRKKRP